MALRCRRPPRPGRLYSSARIAAAAIFTLVHVVLLVLDAVIPGYDMSPGTLLPSWARSSRSWGSRRQRCGGASDDDGVRAPHEQGLRLPDTGLPAALVLASIHITDNQRTAANPDRHQAARDERNYANRPGSSGPSAHYYVARDGWAIEAIDPSRYAAWSNGDVASPNSVNAGIAKVLALRAKGYNANEAYWLEFAATLTDNGAVYTSRFTGGRNGFEYLLAYLGIRQKNGVPGHPQTQGKIERFHQTLKRWLGQQPAARTIAELQRRLDAFRLAYDEQRPHRATGRATPGEACRATPKAHPAGRGASGHFRLRYDIADKKGAITLRRGGRLYHLKIGAAFARRRILAIVDETEVTVVALDTGEILSTHRIEPAKGYWRNTRRDPGRWPGSQATGGSQ